MDHKQAIEEKKKIVTSIKSIVNEMVDNKTITLSKQKNLKIDHDKILSECENRFFNDMQKQGEASLTESLLFLENLKIDDLELYNKLIKEKKKVGGLFHSTC